MSFIVLLDVSGLTFEQAESIMAVAMERDCWPIMVHKRGLFRKKAELFIPSEDEHSRHLLTDTAGWNEPAWDMEPALLPRLGRLIEVLGEYLPQGFTFRATWVSDRVRSEGIVSVNQLIELILDSELNEFTRYRVKSRSEASLVGGQP